MAQQQQQDRQVHLEDGDVVMKVVMVGISGSGRSSFLVRSALGVFDGTERIPRSLSDSVLLPYKMKDDESNGSDDMKEGEGGCVRSIKLQMWDTAGRERFPTITSSYYRGAHGLFMCFDITDITSFESLLAYKQDSDKYSRPGTQLVLLGCKKDLASRRAVSEEDARALATSWGTLYMEASSLSGEGVDDAIEAMSKRIVETNPHVWESTYPFQRPQPTTTTTTTTTKKTKKGNDDYTSKGGAKPKHGLWDRLARWMHS
eukprot:TRINITY_DN4198_c0_g2_i3.p1 TRINITY_DN4198_c0_g2~~TRINITY_DN4198_c0_g2_i3.p1  ORF type:complete len:259 (+),score=64.31 TRINITY_DN4198_c0_g2_i3:1-777(+)